MYRIVKHWINLIHIVSLISCNSGLRDTDEETGNLDKLDSWAKKNLPMLKIDKCKVQNNLRLQNHLRTDWMAKKSSERDLALLVKNKLTAISMLWQWGDPSTYQDASGEPQSAG